MLKPNLKLMAHQQQGVEFALKNNGIAAFFYDPGTGKTLTALSTFDAMRQKNPNLNMLVVCPLSLIQGAWVKEIEKYTEYVWHDLHSGGWGNHKGVIPPDIFIINFESLLSIKRRKEVEDLFTLGNGDEYLVVIDESSKMKNHAAATTEKLLGFWKKGKYTRGIKDYCKHRIVMSGTPVPNNFGEYFCQMKFLSERILGDNFYKFRNHYFQMSRGKEVVKGAVYNKATLSEMFKSGYKYEFNPLLENELFDKIRPWCHMVKAKDCLDLPEQVDEYRMFEMQGEQARVYKEMKTECIAEIKNIQNDMMQGKIALSSIEFKDGESHSMGEPQGFIVANIILTKMMKLRQITSGFAIDENDQVHTIGKDNPKLAMLLEIVEEVGQEQIIVWCQFRHEIQMVVNELKKIGGVSELHGGIDEKDRIEHINNFINGHSRFLVAHPHSAAHGLTFVNCRYSVYFSLSYSYEEYEQSRKRTHRHGQTNKCVYFHLLAAHSVDEDVLAICQKKADKQSTAERFLKS